MKQNCKGSCVSSCMAGSDGLSHKKVDRFDADLPLTFWTQNIEYRAKLDADFLQMNPPRAEQFLHLIMDSDAFINVIKQYGAAMK